MENEQTSSEGTGAALQGGDAAARSAAAAMMGRVRSERKTEAVRKNGLLGGKETKPILSIECKCGQTELLKADGSPAHPTTCKRGRVIRWRLKKGLPLT